MKQTYSGTCLECGKAFSGKRQPAKFCCHACRVAFTNRRRDRGAILYDMVMSGAPRKAVAEFLARCRRMDVTVRGGRQSWLDVSRETL